MRAWLATKFLHLMGWRFVGRLPADRKAVVVAAPHTSNWDFLFLFLVSNILGVRLYWMGKEELFRGPLGPIARALGGIPVKRSRSTNLVQQMVDAFARRRELVLVIPPAGTRRHTDYWKSGFYHIARAAHVPIVLGFVDYGRNQAGFGPIFTPSGEISADMDFIRSFYADIQGKFPAEKSRIRLKAEDEEPTTA